MLYILTPIFCVALLCGTVFSFSKTDAYAYTNSNMPTGNSAIGNLFDSDKGKFNRVNLDRLAKKANYSNINAMITAATGGTTKTAENFGNVVVELGTYNGSGLKWIPSYLSKDDDGNAILTLWLAGTNAQNSGTSNQEFSTWTDGTYSDDAHGIPAATQNLNGKTVYSDSYDGSYIRNYILNGGNDYAKNWGDSYGTVITPPVKSTLTKFTQFTSGALSSYIVTPSKVGWQMAENYMKNDPAFGGNDHVTNENYPIDWTNDKIWLPGVYETVNTVLTADRVAFTKDQQDGGLWKTNDVNRSNEDNKATNDIGTWLRNADGSWHDLTYVTRVSDSFNVQTYSVTIQYSYAVRPALHLNLTKALENAVVHAPANLPNFTYDGKSKWLSDLTGNDVPKWYDSEIYGGNTTYMSVKSTMYEDKLGNAAQSVAVTNIKAAGTYTVTMTLKSGYQWDDKSTGDKTFKIIIDKADPNVSADFVDTNVKKGIYATYNNCTLPELKNTATNATPGTFAWKSGQQPTGPNGFKTTPYEWEFTPDASNINNYDTATGTISINYRTQTVGSLEIIVDDGAQFYDAFTLTDGTYSIKNYITVNGVYQDGITKELVQPEDYTLSLPQAASLTAGTVKIRAKRTSDNKTGDKDITVIASQVMELQAEYDDGGTHLKYSENLTTEDLKDNLTVTAKWNYSGFDFLDVDNADVTITGNLAAGAAPLTMTATYGGESSNFYPVIDKGTLDVSAVKLNGFEHLYDGTAQKIEATGDVKDFISKQVMSGVNLVYTYTKNGAEVAGAAANGVTDAGVYTVTLSFTHSNPNYEAITTTKEATLTINKASFDVSAIKLEVVSPVTYADGVEYTPAISGGEVPSEVTVNYEYDGTTQTTPFTFSNAGTYTVNVTFTHNNANYNDITKTLSATLKIDKADYPGADGIKFENKSASLGTTLTAAATNVPEGVTVTYVYGGKEQNTPFEFTELNESGYVVTAKFAHTNDNYNAIADKTATIVISHKPVYDESGLSFVATGAAGSGTQFTATYGPAAAIDIALTGSVVDKDGASVAVTVEYLYEKKVNGSWQTVSQADLCNAGEYRITASISTGDDTYAAISDREVTLTVAKADFTISVDFDDDTVVYDGDMHGIVIDGTLPDGVEAVYVVTGQSETEFANAGTYEYTVSFTHENDNYNEISKTLTATLTIEQADYPDADKIEFKSQSTSLGLTLTAEVKNVPEGVTVTYICGDDEQSEPFVFADLNLSGYVVTAKFAHSNPNYKPIGDKEATFVIGAKPTYDEDGLSFVATGATGNGTEFTAVYNPNVVVKIELTGSVADQSGTSVAVTVEYLYERYVYGEWVEVTADDLKNAGEYRITASISTGDDLYDVIEDRTVTLTIEKAEADLSTVSFENVTVTYDGELHNVVLKGTLPDYVTVEYLVGGEAFEGAIDMGTYEVVAKFTVDLDLYEQPEAMTAALKIDAKAYDLTGITFENATFVYDGEAHSIFIGGTELPDWITVSYTGNEVSAVGTHIVTAKFAHDNENYSAIDDMTAQIVITKAKVALPVYTGTLSYTGDEVKPTADDFEGFDSALMAFVESKTVAGLNAGSYKAVFALKDGDSYEWATATALKKSLLAVVYAGALADNEAAVAWTLAKAKISAVSGADGKPVFKSDGISVAALAQAVGLKFFADEACTQEIAADKLAYETTYYMQAELLDKTNFEFDKTVTDVVGSPYTTPAKELSTGEKIVNILKTYWLYIVIALVVLIVLILAIVLGTRSAKRKREREERKEEERQAREERKEEERRQREEERRREEREERMARISQPQMQMPQIMPQMMPQMMGQMQQQMPPQPQLAPAAAQTVAAGGSMDSAQIARIENELAAIRAEQNAAKEIASIKSEAAQQISAAKLEAEMAKLRADMNGGAARQISGVPGGMSLEALTEVITVALKNAFGGERPQTVAAQPAQPVQKTDGGAATAATQVPPDAVMTTVTTTKIDTTKKQPAQNAQAQAAPVRTVVRNVVAPMPVDDGRVFDVGGFYKPADPVTDDIDNLLGDENK